MIFRTECESINVKVWKWTCESECAKAKTTFKDKSFIYWGVVDRAIVIWQTKLFWVGGLGVGDQQDVVLGVHLDAVRILRVVPKQNVAPLVLDIEEGGHEDGHEEDEDGDDNDEATVHTLHQSHQAARPALPHVGRKWHLRSNDPKDCRVFPTSTLSEFGISSVQLFLPKWKEYG